MQHELYVANLAPDMVAEEVAEVFASSGNVLEAILLTNQRTGLPRQAAKILLETDLELAEIMHRYNGYDLQNYPVYVTPMRPPQFTKATKEEMDNAQEIANALQETDKQPIGQIRRMVRICGMPFIEAIYRETLAVEEQGGLMVKDGSRRRTLGGVFFFLARRRLSYKMQRAIFFTGQDQNAKAKQNPEGKQKAAKGAPGGKPQGKGKPPFQKPSAPPVDPQALENARGELEYLRRAYGEAQQHLESLKSQPAAERKAGLFSATREVVNLQKQIANILRQYPQLDQ